VHMSAVNLTGPPIAHLYFAVAGGRAVSDYEMIGEAVFHFADLAMVIIEHLRIALAGSAVVYHDEFPAVAGHRRSPDLFDHRSTEIIVFPFRS